MCAQWSGSATNRKEVTQYHTVINAFEKTVALTGTYATRGRKVHVEGRREHRSYKDRNGNEREAAEIIAGDVQFLESKRDGAAVTAQVNGDEVDRWSRRSYSPWAVCSPTSCSRSRHIARAAGDGEQFLGPSDMRGWIGAGATEVFEVGAFIERGSAEGILLMTGHGRLRGGETVITYSEPTPCSFD